jgi:poly(3-hydroxybutyrate) depolymerase
MRARARGALDLLKSRPEVDRDRIAAIGYCVGGTMALELARSGAMTVATVGFHTSIGALRNSRQLQEAIDGTAHNAALVGEQTGVFGQTLEQSRSEIAPVSLDGIWYLIDGLSSETTRMQTLSLDLYHKLEARAEQVRLLTEQLERAQSEVVIDALSGLSNRRGFERAAETLAGSDGLLTHMTYYSQR